MQFGDPIWFDQFDVEAQRPAHRKRVAQPVHLILSIGQTERAASVPCDGLPRLGLQRAGIETNVVVHAFAKAKAAGGMGDLTRGVPGAATCQLAFFEQNDIGPAFMCKVVRQTDAHDAATDNHDLGLGWETLCRHNAPRIRKSSTG